VGKERKGGEKKKFSSHSVVNPQLAAVRRKRKTALISSLNCEADRIKRKRGEKKTEPGARGTGKGRGGGKKGRGEKAQRSIARQPVLPVRPGKRKRPLPLNRNPVYVQIRLKRGGRREKKHPAMNPSSARSRAHRGDEDRGGRGKKKKGARVEARQNLMIGVGDIGFSRRRVTRREEEEEKKLCSSLISRPR